MLDFMALARFYQGEEGIAEFYHETLQLIMATIIGVSFILAFLTIESWDPIPAVAGLWVTVAAMYLTRRRRPTLSAITMILGLTATLTIQIYLYPGSTIALYACTIVLAADGAFGSHAGLSTAALTSAVILAAAHSAPSLLSPDVFLQALVLIWATLFLMRLSARPLHNAVGWAWNSYGLAQANLEQARLRQAELVRMSKSLNEAMDKLERLNQELDDARKAADIARRMKAEFAATVGHELRTPINLIIGFSQMIASPQRTSYYEEPLPEAYRNDIAAIHHNARYISDLVDDILDLSQIDAHRLALRKERFALAQIVQEAVTSIEPLYRDAGLHLTIDLPEDLPRVLADPVRIRQVFVNLLYNAVRFTHEGGVVVTAHVADNEVVAEVIDSGVGIPPEILPELFEEFRQSHATVRGRSGSGLGLAICKRFVELHGGSIWAKSSLGHGTAISFSLPIDANVIAVPLQRAVPQVHYHKPGQPIAAVLDPTGDTAPILHRYLDGYRVKHVTALVQINQLAQDDSLAALILTRRSDQETWQAYQHFRPELQGVPTITCILRTRELTAKTLGVAAYLVKPINREHLAAALHHLGRPVRNVVVIEDDVGMRVLLVRLLHALLPQSHISEADDGVKGLQIIYEKHPDVVLLDLSLPLLDGYSILRTLREDEVLRKIPVVVISARGPDERIVASTVEISRYDGLSVGETVACLKTSLDTLQRIRLEPDWDRAADGRAPMHLASSPG